MFISTLGPLKVQADNGDDITPTAPKLRSLLVLLALRRNHVVSAGSLIDELWGDNAPVSALTTLQTYVYQLRRLLAAHGADGKEVLVTRPLGYEIRLTDDELDVATFTRLTELSRSAMATNNAERALEVLAEALAMSSTAPLNDVCAGPVLRSYVDQLAESVLQAVELRVDAKLRLGHFQELVAELKSLCADNPFHENLHAKLMVCLQRAGRRSEALVVYTTLRRNLTDELGIEPSASLRTLQEKLLSADSSSDIAERPVIASTVAIPAQLPRDIAEFHGRGSELENLSSKLTATDGTAPAVVCLTGAPGTGKSALAVRATREVRDRFEDGQLYAHLRGSSDNPAEPFQILGRFLDAVGFDAAHIPADTAGRAQLFRSWTSERKVAVLLDDAASHAQIRPLLATGPYTATLITGPQSAVCGLEGSVCVQIGTPTDVECLGIFSAIVGEARVAAELDAARTLVEQCDRLPLALRVVGAKLAANPSQRLITMANRLADPATRLAQLRFGEWDVERTIRSGHGLLDADADAILRHLVGIDAAEVPLASVATALSMTPLAVELAVEQLIRSRFATGSDCFGASGTTCVSVSELMRAFLAERASVSEIVTARPSAGSELGDQDRHTA